MDSSLARGLVIGCMGEWSGRCCISGFAWRFDPPSCLIGYRLLVSNPRSSCITGSWRHWRISLRIQTTLRYSLGMGSQVDRACVGEPGRRG